MPCPPVDNTLTKYILPAFITDRNEDSTKSRKSISNNVLPMSAALVLLIVKLQKRIHTTDKDKNIHSSGGSTGILHQSDSNQATYKYALPSHKNKQTNKQSKSKYERDKEGKNSQGVPRPTHSKRRGEGDTRPSLSLPISLFPFIPLSPQTPTQGSSTPSPTHTPTSAPSPPAFPQTIRRKRRTRLRDSYFKIHKHAADVLASYTPTGAHAAR